jgi:hypothetical protein
MWCLALSLGFWRDASAKCNPRRFLLRPNRQRLSVNNNKAVLRSPEARARRLYARLTRLTPLPQHPSSSISRAEGNTEAANHHHRATPLSTSYILVSDLLCYCRHHSLSHSFSAFLGTHQHMQRKSTIRCPDTVQPSATCGCSGIRCLSYRQTQSRI